MPSQKEIQAAKGRCLFGAQLNVMNLVDSNGDPINIVEQFPQCPPTRDLVLVSTQFISFESFGTNCYRLRDTFMPDRDRNLLMRDYIFTGTCCYDQNG